MSKVAEIIEAKTVKELEVKSIFDEADEKTDGVLSEDARDKVKSLNREIADMDKRAADINSDEALRLSNAAALKELTQPVGRPLFSGAPLSAKGTVAGAEAKSLGQLFLENQEWQSYFKGLAPTGSVSDGTAVRGPKLLLPAGLKTLITGVGATSGGAFTIPDQSGIYDALGRKPLSVKDIISRRTTGSDMIEFVRQLTRENAAAMVPEATSSSGSSGVKPEGGMTWERVLTNVKTCAQWVPATKRSLSDAGQLRGIIDDELRADLDEEIDDQILNGDGVGENFEGLDAVSGTQDQAWSSNILQTTRKARTLVRTVGRATPSAYVLNPTDWETLDLIQDNEARYFFGGPREIGTPRLWGLPVVEEEAQAVGFGWVGDWKRAVLWDREQAMISVSDAHADFFIRNLVAILGELRAAFAVIRPAAFVEMDLTA